MLKVKKCLKFPKMAKIEFLAQDFLKDITLMSENFANFANDPSIREIKWTRKKSFCWFAKINSHETQFSDFLGYFCLFEHKNKLFSLFYQCFCLGKSNLNWSYWFAKLNSIKTREISRMAWFAKFSVRKIFWH